MKIHINGGNDFVGNVKHRHIRDELGHRYEYFGLEFGFDYSDVMALQSGYMGLSRLEFLFRFRALERYNVENIKLRISFTILKDRKSTRLNSSHL